MISIDDFCDEHRACKDGREWAIANCSDMPDAWEKLRPDWLIWIATRPGVLTDRELRLFAVFCARQVEHLLTDQRSIDAISMAEKFAKGEATTGELTAAWAASDAAWAASDAAGAAAWADSDAARDAADAAGAAARAAARDAQSDWLRENTKPNFGVEVTS